MPTENFLLENTSCCLFSTHYVQDTLHLFLYQGAAWDPCIPELSAWAQDLAQLPIPLPANAHPGGSR